MENGLNLGLADLFAIPMCNKDPFVDSPLTLVDKGSIRNHDFIPDHDKLYKINKRTLVFGQIVARAAKACALYHRVFYFTILVIGTYARFIRWDRAGAIVMRKFNYKDNPEFLWRFGNASPEQRGFDPTVSIATEIEEKIFYESIHKHVLAHSRPKDRDNDDKTKDKMDRQYVQGKIDVYNKAKGMIE